MFKFKRLVSSAVASVMALTLAATTSFAAIPTDVVGTNYEEPSQVLGALNIMVGDKESGLFRPDDSIIRSEVSKVAVATLGLTDVAEVTNGATKYPDVVADHWANGYINVATNQNLVVGDDVGTFRPDESITYAEAVTILVRALGYEKQAISKGGYPTGYLVTASSIGLTKGVSLNANQAISRGDVSRLTFNALTIKLMEQVGFDNNERWEVGEKTLLKDNLGVEKIEGQVKAVGGSSLTGTSSLKDNEIMIGNKVYEVGSANVSEVLGFNVVAYIDEDGNNKNGVALLVLPDTTLNTVVKIASDNIDTIVNTETEKTVNYWVNQETDNKTSKASIATDAIVMYNGRLGSFADLKKMESGSITLLDTESTGKYNVVFVNETENYVVKEVSISSNKIVDKYGKDSIVLDPEDEDLTFVIEKGADKIGIEDLNEWDVLQVTKSRDNELVRIVVCNDKVEGKITVKQNDKFFIDGKGYKVASNYKATISLGDEGTFYLDVDGKIAATQSHSVTSNNYAYLVDIAEDGVFNKKLSIQLYTKDGEDVILTGASKIRVDDKKDLSGQEVIDALKGNKASASGQLITFEKNSNGEVYKMYTAEANSDINKDKFTQNLKENGVVYKATSKKLIGANMSVNVNADTKVFCIPDGKTDPKDFSVNNSSYFVNDDIYDVEVYDVDESMTAKVVVVTTAKSTIGEENAIAVVDTIALTTNADDDDVEKLYAYQNGEKIEINTSETDVLVKGDSKKPLEQGDVIQYAKNAKGEITEVKVLFDISTKAVEAKNNVSANVVTLYGTVSNKFTDSFNMQVNNGAVQNLTIGDADIYKVDTTKTKSQVTVGDAGSIQKEEGTKVFVRIYKDVVQEIIIVK